MKQIFSTALIILMLVSATAHADSAFVNDIIEITMRLGPGVDFKVIRTLSSGNKVEVLETKNGWSRIRTKDGATGWVVARYLTGTEPISRVAKQARAGMDALSAKQEALRAENEGLAGEKTNLEQQLADLSASFEQTKKALADLREASKGFLDLKAAHGKCEAALDARNHAISSLEQDARTRRLTAGLKWFLAGAGVLLVGVLIGLSTRRKRSPLR